MRGKTTTTAALAALLLALALGAPTAQAGVNGVIPADSNGPNADFLTTDALWAAGTADPVSGIGQLCVVSADDTGSGSCGANGMWGQPNAIGTLGTYLQPIVAAPLAPGTWRILADNGDGNPAANLLSEPFTVTPCVGAGCTTDIADSQLAAWKTDASAALDGPALACLASTAYVLSGDPVAGTAAFIGAGGIRAALISVVQTQSPALKFMTPDDSLSAAVSLAQKVSCGAYLMLGDIIADPPDADFRHPTAPAPELLAQTGDPAGDAAGQAVEEVRVQGVAQRVGVERYAGAVAAGATGWSSFQASRLGLAGMHLQQAMRKAAPKLRALAAELDGDAAIAPASSAQVTAARAIHTRIRTSGFLPAEQADLEQMGLDAAAIAAVREQLGRALPPGSGSTSPADGLRSEATAFEHVSCSATFGSVCGFDAFSRLGVSVGASTRVLPELELADATLREGDTGVSHVRVRVRLSHPTETYVTGQVELADPAAHPGVTVTGGVVLAPGSASTTVGLTVKGDTVPEGDEHLALRVTPGQGVDVTVPATSHEVVVRDDDTGAGHPFGAHGLLAFTRTSSTTPGLATVIAEPDGTNLTTGYADTPLERLHVTDWSRDGRHQLLQRVPHTLQDADGFGTPYFTLPVGPDGHATGTPTQVTPVGDFAGGASLSSDGRRLAYGVQGGTPFWRLVVQGLDAAGMPTGTPHVLGDDPQLAGWEEDGEQAGWSPDGGRVLFQACEPHWLVCGVYAIAVDAQGAATAAPVPVVTHPSDQGPRQGNPDDTYVSPSWSPDGRFVAYVHITAGRKAAGSTLERVPVGATGAATGPPVVLSDLDPLGGSLYSASPSWAADSEAIAFTGDAGRLTGTVSDPASMVAALDGGGHAVGSPTLVSPLGWGEGGVVWGPAIPAKDPAPQAPVGSPTVTTPPGPLLMPPPRSTPFPVLNIPKAPAAAVLPSAKACISRRHFRIRLARPSLDPLVAATVTVNGKRVATVRGARLTALVDLRGLPPGTVRLAVAARTRTGRTLVAARTYHTCASRRRR